MPAAVDVDVDIIRLAIIATAHLGLIL